jgi:hypothetical protein
VILPPLSFLGESDGGKDKEREGEIRRKGRGKGKVTQKEYKGVREKGLALYYALHFTWITVL